MIHDILYEPEDDLDDEAVRALFDDLGPLDDLHGGQPKGRPDDYPGLEILWVLRDIQKGRRAGKSYKPDPTGRRRAVKAADYKSGYQFFAKPVVVETLDELYDLLEYLAPDPTVFVVRGELAEGFGIPRRLKKTGEQGYQTVRRLIRIHGPNGAFEALHRQLQMLDFDGIPLPPGMSVITDPEACVKWAVDHLLPGEFHDVDFIYQLSSSAGLTKADDVLNVHLWFFTNRPYWDEELRAWANWWNARQRNKIVDPALYNPVQPHYTSDPELLDGLTDPLAGRRLGLVRRRRRTVPLHMPSEAELAAEGRSKAQRVRQAHSRIRDRRGAADAGNADKSSDAEAEPAKPETDDASEAGLEDLGAVRMGSGWRGYLAAIGFEGHIRTQIRAAIGSYFHEYGSGADSRFLRDAIEKAIKESPFLDCDEAWSRRRGDALDYLEPDGNSNVDEMVRDIAAYEKAKERREGEVFEPSWSLPINTKDEAFEQVEEAIRHVVNDARKLRERRAGATSDFVEIDLLFNPPSRTAVLCEPGVGKTEAMIGAIAEFIRGHPVARVAIAVPTHALGQGLAARVNRAFGSEVAAEWYGANHPDPRNPSTNMCRLADAVKELRSAGGKPQLLCSGRDHQYCPHHPNVAGLDKCCGYLRQQQRSITANVRVWVIPAAMIATAPPRAIGRPGQMVPFDLFVIDEGPWFGLLAGLDDKDPVGAPVDWLAPGWWRRQTPHAEEDEKATAVETLTKIHRVLAGRQLGQVPPDAFRSAGVSEPAVKQARRFVLRCKQDLRPVVTPGASRADLALAIAKLAPVNRRVIAVAQVLQVIGMQLQGRMAPSGIELIEGSSPGGRFLRLRWRKDIHPAWLRAPALYLDAAGTGAEKIAKAWLPEIDVLVNATAAAPHMRITQVANTQMSYRMIFGHGPAKATAAANRERIGRVIEVWGDDGLIVCPKELHETWEGAQRLPGWILWHYNAIRGRDEAGTVRRLAVVSRPMPRPADAEIQAETIFGREVNKLAPGQFYPKVEVGRLMSDGTGRRVLAYQHPDPLVEAVRFATCEGELVQAVGRGRGVQRTVERPLDVLVLTNVPLPLPIDKTVDWESLCDAAGPIEVLAARGVVPLDYAEMATALSEWFSGRQALTDWFSERPEALTRLRQLRDRANGGGWVEINEFLGFAYKDIFIGRSEKLSSFRYSRNGSRQSNLVLVDLAIHGDARAAVELVLGRLDRFEPVALVSDDDRNDNSEEAHTEADDTAEPTQADLERVRRMFAEIGI